MIITISVAQLIALAVAAIKLPRFALPLWLSIMLFVSRVQGGGSIFDALLLSLAAGLGLYLAGVLALLHSPRPIQLLVVLLFALPAGLLGYHFILDLGHLLGSRTPFSTVWASIGAVSYAAMAARSLLGSAFYAPDPPVWSRSWKAGEWSKAR